MPIFLVELAFFLDFYQINANLPSVLATAISGRGIPKKPRIKKLIAKLPGLCHYILIPVSLIALLFFLFKNMKISFFFISLSNAY